MFSPQFVAQCVEGTCAEKSQSNPKITSMYICKSKVLQLQHASLHVMLLLLSLPQYKRYSKLQDLMIFLIQKFRFDPLHAKMTPLWGWNACGIKKTLKNHLSWSQAAQPFSSNDLLKCVKKLMKITWKNQQKTSNHLNQQVESSVGHKD